MRIFFFITLDNQRFRWKGKYLDRKSDYQTILNTNAVSKLTAFVFNMDNVLFYLLQQLQHLLSLQYQIPDLFLRDSIFQLIGKIQIIIYHL